MNVCAGGGQFFLNKKLSHRSLHLRSTVSSQNLLKESVSRVQNIVYENHGNLFRFAKHVKRDKLERLGVLPLSKTSYLRLLSRARTLSVFFFQTNSIAVETISVSRIPVS